MVWTFLLFCLPLLPFFVRMFVWFFLWKKLQIVLKPAVANREHSQGVVLSLAGFSFTALMGLAVVDATTKQELQYAVYFSLTSFLSFFWAYGIQAYKKNFLHDQIADTFVQAANLSLMLVIITVLSSTLGWTTMTICITFIVLATWLFDFLIRTLVDYGMFQDM